MKNDEEYKFVVFSRKRFLEVLNTKRFEEVYTQGVLKGMEIWVDNETGVNYLVYVNGSAGGMTPLLDSAGNVVVTPVSRRNYDRYEK